MRRKFVLVLFLFIVFLPLAVYATIPDVNLISPLDNDVSTSENITFICNVSDDENLYNVSLFHDINGTFELYNTKDIMRSDPDSNTTLLCHFDSAYSCEVGSTATNSGTDFMQSKFFKGVRMNDSDTLSYPTSGNIDYYRGTVEFWIQPKYNTSDLGDMAYFFSADASSGENNKMDLYINYGDITFEFYDDYGSSANAQVNVNWLENEWHHVAITWDFYLGEDQLDIFVDGDNSSTTHSGSIYSPGGQFGDNIYLGTIQGGGYLEHSVYDEFRISERVLTSSEVSASYSKGAGDHRNESVNWTLNNLPDGSYAWTCLAYDNESQSSASSNYTLHIDVSAKPTLNSVTFSPSGNDNIDPGMNISVFTNVTDVSNVSYVMFQWKETDPWNNITMDYNNVTELYENATIEIDQTGGVYYYRTWSNDSNGNSGYSSTYNITAGWDYTWNSTPSDFGTVYEYVETSNAYLGTIIINNTGDDSLSFQLTDDRPFIYLYYNTTNPFSLGAKEVVHVNVTADFPSQRGEYDVVISINATHGTQTPSPTWSQVTTTLNSYNGGPYFNSNYIYMISYPTTAYQSNSYNLSVKLKNIGNETAPDTWINWTLPTGWSVTSGNQSKYVGDLNGTADGGNIAWNNVTVYLSSGSSTAGVHNISVTATANGSLTANASVTTYVECNNDDDTCGAGCSYITDDDCSVPQSPGGPASSISGITLPAVKDYKITLIIPGRLDVNRGESKTIQVGVKNDVTGTELGSIFLSFSGYPKTFVVVSPSSLTGIGYGETKYFDIEVRAPIYAIHEKYDFDITVKGDFAEGSKTTSSENTGSVTLVTHKLITNNTLEYFEKADEAVKEMEESGFETRKLNEMVDEIENALDEGNYDKVMEVSKNIIELKDLAFRLDKQINDLSRNVEDLNIKGFDLPETKKMLFLAKSAFQRGEYIRADERIASAMLMNTLEAGGASFWIFVYNYWWTILIVVAIIGVGLFTGRKKLLIRYMLKKLDSLEIEEKKTKDLVIELQKKYVKAKISTAEYTEMIENYESGIGDIRKERANILSIIIKSMNFDKSMNVLKDEEDRVKKIIIETQKDYFLKGRMGKDYYERIMDGMKSELLEIRKHTDSLKEKKSGKKASIIPVLFAFFLLISSAAAVERGDVLNAIETAEKTVIEMQLLGFGVTYANDTLNEAKSLFDDGYYEGAESLALKVLTIKDKAINVDELINEVELKIYELSSKGYDTSDVSEVFQSGLSEFEIDNYVDAEKIMRHALEDMDQLEAEESLRRIQTHDRSIIDLIFDYLWIIIIIALILIVAGFNAKGKLYMRRCRNEFSDLKKELVLINKSISETQKKYFIRNVIGKMDYELTMKRHGKRISVVNRRISMLEEILKK